MVFPGLEEVGGGDAGKGEPNGLELELLGSEANVLAVAVGSADGFEANGDENNEEENIFCAQISARYSHRQRYNIRSLQEHLC